MVKNSSETSVTHWQGQLALTFDWKAGRTRLARQEARVPLAFQKPFYPEGGEICHGTILHPSGGIANDDRLVMGIALENDARVLLTTPGASKVYGSAAGAIQTVRVSLAEGAAMEWLPQETIIFDGAQIQSELRVFLERNTSWLSWDVLRFGRSGAGERFAAGHWKSATEIWQNGRPLWIDRQLLAGGSPLLETAFGLKGQPVMGTLVWIGKAVDQDTLDRCRQCGTYGHAEAEFAVTRLEHGLVARYLGASTANARRCFVAIWRILREVMFHRPLCPPRVWNT